MTTLITDVIRARVTAAGAVAAELDLYEGAGTDFYQRLVGADRAEIREVMALARRAEGPILDIAAGAGRLTIPLVRAGHRVTAVDLSDDMLAHLRHAVRDQPSLECVVADMRDLRLARRYALAVLGATSITLLDRKGRSRLYRSVQRHLADDGVFALTVASGASAAALGVPREEEIVVPGSGAPETYLFAQRIDDDGATRVVNWVRTADLVAGGVATVLTSRLRVLDRDTLARELISAGFAPPDVSRVRTLGGQDIDLLVTTAAGFRQGSDDDAVA
ncbi:daptide-type RiPP biosynthesis methyltransferase [Microbacterium sp. 1.5R]|uniref:daptide-type RiPP biosynthesis methyltransferase n=1 Tax=Microbacterium sp. 1.5R TaxID=1916917 RepID=UPI0011A5EEEF|nr:daptide-type RiPP biosynthesis methyltransferase [Microbacterium sp. 1.5R]